jgi:hypothetical protein
VRAESSSLTDFSGLSNQAPRVTSYSDVMAPQVASTGATTGFEAAAFRLEKPPAPFILKPRPPISVSPLVSRFPQ